MSEPLVISEVLFPTDFSDASRPAWATALALVCRFGARLHVLHVVPPVTDPTTAPAEIRALTAEVPTGVSVVTAITSGLPARQVVEYARRNAIDVIVIGTHGRTGVSRALLGSVAESVVRRAPCRVLTVPAALSVTPLEPALTPGMETTSCLVCGRRTSEELICEPCRAKIRGEALERKLREERAGR